MLILDESIENPLIARSIATWYPGQVTSIRTLRPATLIRDEAIPTILYRVRQPTFVTINVDDFWKRTPADLRYAIVALEIQQNRASYLSILLRNLLRLPELRTKTLRMGKVIHVRPTYIEYYEADRQIRTLAWPD